jgi:hypothetical protein
MISELNRKRLEWMATARKGDLFPEDLGFLQNDWDGPIREAAQAALNEIDELKRRLGDGP